MINDFEKKWLAKLGHGLEEYAGREIRNRILAGSEGLSDNSNRQTVIEWSRQAMERLDELVDSEQRVKIMTSCACQYPKSDLQEIRAQYEATGDIDLVHDMLQDKFLSFLKGDLQLADDIIHELLKRGMGLAGIRDGNTIIATKIPKSGFIADYFKEGDPLKKKALYCHCPRIRDSLKTDIGISETYCYCGAGYYKGIWEEIIQRPVMVEVLESVLKGDDACKIAVHLPV